MKYLFECEVMRETFNMNRSCRFVSLQTLRTGTVIVDMNMKY